MSVGSAVAVVRAVRRAGARASAAAADRLRAGGVVPLQLVAANCLGHSFPGVAQVRGAGVLALNRSSVRFQLGMPDRAVDLAYDDIDSVESGTTFRRPGFRRTHRAPVALTIRTRDGAVIGFALTDAPQWAELIGAEVARAR